VSATLAQGPAALMDLLHNIGAIALFVLALLLLASLYSWTVIFGKIGSFRSATKESKSFIRAFERRRASRRLPHSRKRTNRALWRRSSLRFLRPTSVRREAAARREISLLSSDPLRPPRASRLPRWKDA